MSQTGSCSHRTLTIFDSLIFKMVRGPPTIVILRKENINLKNGRPSKNHLCFMKTQCSKIEDYLRKTKPLKRANLSSVGVGGNLSMETLSYNLTETRLAERRNQRSFFLKKQIFPKIHEQHKLSTKILNCLYWNFNENQLQLLLVRLNYKTVK